MIDKASLLSQIEFLKSSIIRMEYQAEAQNQELEDMHRRLEEAEVALAKELFDEDLYYYNGGC